MEKTLADRIAEAVNAGLYSGDEYEVFENNKGGLTFQIFTSAWSFEEYNFDMLGNPLEGWEIGIGCEPRKIF